MTVLEVEFADDDLDRLEVDPKFTAGHGVQVDKGFRKAMTAIRAAKDTRDLYNGGLQTKRMKGARQHQHEIRLNIQWRLIVEVDEPKIKIIAIEDVH
jgi:proteic killer suppression protein